MRNQSDISGLLQRRYSINIGDFIGRGWELLNQNLGLFIGFSLVVSVINSILFVMSLIPLIGLVGSLISLVVGGPLSAGYYIVYFRLARRQKADFGDFFNGFKNTNFLQIFLASLVIYVFAVLCLAPVGIVIAIASAISDSIPSPVLILVMALLLLVGLIGALYLVVSYAFAIPFIVAKKLEFWPAMEVSRKLIGQQWFGFLGLLIVLGLINVAGFLVCGVGLLLTIPLTACALAAAYERIVGL